MSHWHSSVGKSHAWHTCNVYGIHLSPLVIKSHGPLSSWQDGKAFPRKIPHMYSKGWCGAQNYGSVCIALCYWSLSSELTKGHTGQSVHWLLSNILHSVFYLTTGGLQYFKTNKLCFQKRETIVKVCIFFSLENIKIFMYTITIALAYETEGCGVFMSFVPSFFNFPSLSNLFWEYRSFVLS